MQVLMKDNWQSSRSDTDTVTSRIYRTPCRKHILDLLNSVHFDRRREHLFFERQRYSFSLLKLCFTPRRRHSGRPSRPRWVRWWRRRTGAASCWTARWISSARKPCMASYPSSPLDHPRSSAFWVPLRRLHTRQHSLNTTQNHSTLCLQCDFPALWCGLRWPCWRHWKRAREKRFNISIWTAYLTGPWQNTTPWILHAEHCGQRRRQRRARWTFLWWRLEQTHRSTAPAADCSRPGRCRRPRSHSDTGCELPGWNHGKSETPPASSNANACWLGNEAHLSSTLKGRRKIFALPNFELLATLGAFFSGIFFRVEGAEYGETIWLCGTLDYQPRPERTFSLSTWIFHWHLDERGYVFPAPKSGDEISPEPETTARPFGLQAARPLSSSSLSSSESTHIVCVSWLSVCHQDVCLHVRRSVMRRTHIIWNRDHVSFSFDILFVPKSFPYRTNAVNKNLWVYRGQFC